MLTYKNNDIGFIPTNETIILIAFHFFFASFLNAKFTFHHNIYVKLDYHIVLNEAFDYYFKARKHFEIKSNKKPIKNVRPTLDNTIGTKDIGSKNDSMKGNWISYFEW